MKLLMKQTLVTFANCGAVGCVSIFGVVGCVIFGVVGCVIICGVVGCVILGVVGCVIICGVVGCVKGGVVGWVICPPVLFVLFKNRLFKYINDRLIICKLLSRCYYRTHLLHLKVRECYVVLPTTV